MEMGLYSHGTGLDPSVTYIPYIAILSTYILHSIVPEPNACVYSHTPSLCSVSFPLPMNSAWKSFITFAVPLFFHLGEAAQSSLSVALLCLYSALLSALHMLCGYLHAVLALCSYGKYWLRQGPVSCF